MANKFKTSTGELVTQSTIDRKRSATYRRMYSDGAVWCRGCGYAAQGSAHIIPQKVAKEEGMTELCWEEENIIPTCHECNSTIESYKGKEFWELMCLDCVLEITEKYLPQRYFKILHEKDHIPTEAYPSNRTEVANA